MKRRFRSVMAVLLTVTTFFSTTASALEGTIERASPVIGNAVNLAMSSMAEVGDSISENIEFIGTAIEDDVAVLALHSKDTWSKKEIYEIYKEGYALEDIGKALELSRQLGEKPYTLLEKKGKPELQVVEKPQVATMSNDPEVDSDEIDSEDEFMVSYAPEKDWDTVVAEVVNDTTYSEEMQQIKEYGLDAFIDSTNFTADEQDYLDFELNSGMSTMSSSSLTEEDIVDVYNNYVLPQSKYSQYNTNLINENSDEFMINDVTRNSTIKTTDLTLKGKNGLDLNLTRVNSLSNAGVESPYVMLSRLIDDDDDDEYDYDYTIFKEYFSVTAFANVRVRYSDALPDGSYIKTFTSQKVAIRPSDQDSSDYVIVSEDVLETDRDRLASGREPLNMFDNRQKAEEAKLKAENGEISSCRYSLGSYGNITYVEFEIIDVVGTVKFIEEGEYEIIQTSTGDDVFWTTYEEIDLSEKYSNIGIGWEFDFPYIEYRYSPRDSIEYDTRYLHYGDKGVWLIDDDNKLEGYHLSDVTIGGGVYFNGKYCTDTLTEKDGKKYYFGEDGQLFGIEDRFGNSIKFEYEDVNYPKCVTKIIDSVGREIVFDYSNNLQTTVTVIDKNDNTENRVLTYNKTLCDGAVDYYLLSSVVDFEGNQTSYTYGSLSLKTSLTSKTFDNDNYADITHHYVTQIDQPTGSYVKFSFSNKLGNCGSDGLAYKLHCNNYRVYSTSHNDPSKKTITHGESVTRPSAGGNNRYVIEYDGYPRYRNTEEIPIEVKIGTIRTESIYGDDIYTTYVYSRPNENQDWLCAEKSIMREDVHSAYPKYLTRTEYTYNTLNQCIKEVTKKYNDTTNWTVHQDIPVEYTYDKYNNLLKVKPYGDENYATTYTYDSTYHLPTQKTYKKDANTTITESYTLTTDKKAIASATASENGVTKRKREYVYDSYGNVITEKQYTGNNSWQEYIPIQFSYDDLSTNTNKINGANLSKITVTGLKDADGQTIDTIEHQYTYDWFGNVKTETDQNGNTFSYTYDKLNRPIQMTNPEQGTITLSYSIGLSNNYVQITDENQKVFKYTYDPLGTLIEEKDVTANAVLRSYAKDFCTEEGTENYISRSDVTEHSNNGNTIKTSTYSSFCDGVLYAEKTDANGNVLYREDYDYEYAVNNTYDTVTKTVKGETADKDFIIKQYIDKYGNVFKEEVTYKNGDTTETFTTEYTHDFLGNVTSVTTPRASAEGWTGETRTARYEYDIDGQVTKMTDIYGNYTINEYDGLGRLVRTADAESTATSAPYYTTFTYDGLGRLLETQTPISANVYSQVKNYYDANGNVTSQKVKNGTNDYSVTTTQYNWRNQPTKILTDGTDTAYQYDAVGNIIKLYTGELANLTDNYTGADYKLTQYAYDSMGNVISETDSLGKTVYNTYDINGNLTKTIDRNGKTINYVYDPLKNLIKKSAQNGETEEEIYTYSYNPQGLLLSMTGGGVDSTYTYDNLGRLIREVLTNGTVKQYNYDEHGNRTSFILTKDNTEQMNVSYSYDKLDRLSSMTANGVTTNYTYDRNGRLLSGNSGGFNTAYTYNLGGMVTGLTTQKGNTAIQSHSYTYLPNGNMSGKQSTVGSQTTNYAYQYDKAGRLTNETINSVPTAYTYDAWGNRASMTGNGTSSTYTYDANNRLTKSITEEGSTTTTADYYYDHNGNQITKAVSVTTPQSGIAAYFMSPQTNSYLSMYEYDSYNRLKSADADGTVTTYTYDGNNLRQSKTTNGITTQHIWDGSNMVMDGTNKFYRGATGIEFAVLNGNTSFYHKDAHCDVTALTNSAGTITQSYIYDAFGNQLNENENDINPFRYCGEYIDIETGLTYLRNRYYDNAAGRFITQDPIKDGLNWYIYCGNNPVMFFDPLGLKDVMLRTFVEERGGTVTWNSMNKSATVDFGSAGSKTYYAGIHKPRSDDTYSSEVPYLKMNADGGMSMYINDQDIINDFGVVDFESRDIPELNSSVTFTLFHKGRNYYQRMTINDKELLYEKVRYKNFDFYTVSTNGRYNIGYSNVNASDSYTVNNEWKDTVRFYVDFLSSEPAVGTNINFCFSIISLYTSYNLQSDSIIGYTDYAVRFRNRNYYIKPDTLNLIAYTKYSR